MLAITALFIYLPRAATAQPSTVSPQPVYVPFSTTSPSYGSSYTTPISGPVLLDAAGSAAPIAPTPVYGVIARTSDDSDDAQTAAEQQEAAALVQKFTFLQHLQRSPALVLRMKAQQAAPADKAVRSVKPESAKASPNAEKEAEAGKQFAVDFVTGNWKAIGTHLSALPKDSGSKIYGFLLTQLAGGKNLILPDDVLALADAAPTELESQQLAMLGRILQQSQERIGVPRATLASLRAGTARLGGNNPARRLAAARLLVAADMLDEAQTYLPPMADVLQKKEPRVLNLVTLCLQRIGTRKDDKEALDKAWTLTGIVLAAPQVSDADRAEAIERALSLLPQLPEALVVGWITTLAEKQRPLCLLILAESAQMAETSFRNKATESRVQAIAAQYRLTQGLLHLAAKDRDGWSDTVRLMTLGWLNEATYSISLDSDVEESERTAVESPSYSSGAYRPAASYGSQTSGLPGRWPASRMRRDHGNNEPSPLDAKALLPLCPSEAWCQAVDPDLARQMRRLTAIIAAEAGDRMRTFAGIRACLKDDPKLARQLAEQYFGNWLAMLMGRNPDGSSDADRNNGYPSYRTGPNGVSYTVCTPYYNNGSPNGNNGGVPLIRAKQVRNLAALAAELKVIHELGTLPVHDDLIAAAFDSCHSPAEVYREEDLRQVFGSPQSMSRGLVLQLVSTMRTKLVGQWAKPETQEQANTQRSDKDMVAEILRGYALAESLLAGMEKREPGDADLVALRAAVAFDQSEFLYGQKADLKTYTALRDRAFADFQRAVDLYAKALPSLPLAEQSANIYMRWFQSALGASDLAYLTRQDKPDADQIERIAVAIRRLGEKAADRHLQMFGAAITASMGEVPPHLKPHFLRSAMRVLGDHSAGNAPRDRLRFYDELLGEVQLHAEVDGNSQVGHGQSFGVRLSIRYTTALGRESNAFVNLLQKSYSSGREVDQPKVIEQTIGEKLAQTFEVEMVRFHDPKAAGRGFGRPGWLETPLAYLVLRAKTGSVDRLPAIPVDLEFNDGAGMVLLPVASQVVLIDARDEHPAARPCHDMKVRQLWDDRRLASGNAQLEVMATAQGLVPALDQVIHTGSGTMPGFRVTKLQDQRLEMKSLETIGGQIEPVTERRWMIDIEPDPAVSAPAREFVFPTAAGPSTALEYQRYDDADVVTVGSTIPLRSVPTARQIGLWIGGGVGVAALLAIGLSICMYVRRHRGVKASGPRYHRPEPLTPFSLVVLLKRLQGDGVVSLSESDRHALGETIADLEHRFFHRSAAPAASADLSALVDRWLAVTGNGHAPRAGTGAQR